MPLEITVPRLGWTMEQGTFVGWLKKDGESVRAGEPLFTLDGDKALQDIEAIGSGILRIASDAPSPGSTVRVGDVLGYLLAPGEDVPGGRRGAPSPPLATTPGAPEKPIAPPAPLSAPGSHGPAKAVEAMAITPRARRLAAALGVDWSQLRGSGRTGRIREADVRAAAKTSPQQVPHAKICGK